MKQQQILAIALVLFVQQVYFFTAVNSAAPDTSNPVSADLTTKNDDSSNATITTPTTTPNASSTTVTPTPKPSPPSSTTSTTTTPTTTTTTTIKTTEATTVKPTQPPQPPRHFDLPSFIGGIVLTIGLIGIGFVGHKIYKSKFDRNYHTL